MKYREQIMSFLSDDELDGEAFASWVQQQPLLDQPDILREFKFIVAEIAGEREDDYSIEVLKEMRDLDEKIDAYEDAILDEKLAEAKYVMALEELDKSMAEMFKIVEGIRKYIIECIITNAPNAKEMRELSKQIIKLEVDAGIYDPENWRDIL